MSISAQVDVAVWEADTLEREGTSKLSGGRFGVIVYPLRTEDSRPACCFDSTLWEGGHKGLKTCYLVRKDPADVERMLKQSGSEK